MSKPGLRKKKAFHRTFLMNCSVLFINDLIYCFSLHVGIFFVEYPRFICSSGWSGFRLRFRSISVIIIPLKCSTILLELYSLKISWNN